MGILFLVFLTIGLFWIGWVEALILIGLIIIGSILIRFQNKKDAESEMKKNA